MYLVLLTILLYIIYENNDYKEILLYIHLFNICTYIQNIRFLCLSYLFFFILSYFSIIMMLGCQYNFLITINLILIFLLSTLLEYQILGLILILILVLVILEILFLIQIFYFIFHYYYSYFYFII